VSAFESVVEEAAVERLRELGYSYRPGVELEEERGSTAEVILPERLRRVLTRLNPDLPPDAQDDAARRLLQPPTASTEENNRLFHRDLTRGFALEVRRNGDIRGEHVAAVAWDDPDANDWLVTNQLTVRGPDRPQRPDLVVYLNGLPVAVAELKSPGDPQATLESAWDQLQQYKQQIPALFDTNELLVISDGTEARLGSLTAGFEWFGPWKSLKGERPPPGTRSTLNLLLEGLFDRRRLLSYLRHYVYWDLGGDRPVKKIAGYHQFHAVEKAVAKTIERYREGGDRRIGVIWHTQGSGKSVSMVFYAGKVVREPALENPTLVVLTDRIDLDDQLLGQLAGARDLLPSPVQATSREHLQELLSVASGGIVFTTLQKFSTPAGVRMPELTGRRNVIVLADEAHRSHYEFSEGLAKNLRDALPNALYLGFTGTPIELADRSTRGVFGEYLDAYPMSQSVADEATVPILYEARQDRVYALDTVLRRIDSEVAETLADVPEAERERLEREETRLTSLMGSPALLESVAEDLVRHWEARQKQLVGKGMIVAPSRDVAALLYDQIVALRPDWHGESDDAGRIKVVMSAGAGPGILEPHLRDTRRTKEIERRFKDPDDPLELVVVVDMWLTGFDVPPVHTLYLYKPMQGHTLMQAIARVNRVWRDKPAGLIVDYVGVGEELKRAVGEYGGWPGESTTVPVEEKLRALRERFEVVEAMYHGFDRAPFFEGDAQARVATLAGAADHVLALADGKERFLAAMTALNQASGMALHLEEARELREPIAFFQAVERNVRKYAVSEAEARPEARLSQAERERHRHAIRQIVAGSIASEGVIDVFEAAGLPKPEISILSEEFLSAVKRSPYQNLQVELLRKLLEDELRYQRRHNVVQARRFSEMLERTLQRYRNRSIQAAQVILELIDLAREVRDAPKRGAKLGLSDDELSFYDALADHENVREVMGDETLAEIAHDLVRSIRRSVTIDWTQKEAIRARMRAQVRRLLRRHGYPPDKQPAAVETVLRQAETLCRDWGEKNGRRREGEPPARIVLDERGVPMIAGTPFKVVQIVSRWKAYQETPEEMAADMPLLSLEQVEAAFDYYRAHQEEIDADIERRAAKVERLREEMGQPPFVERLRKPS
jgi:type I restriction enzyme R subunit